MTYSKETDLASDLIKWLTMSGWECFQEVSVHGAAPVDIVAVKSKPGSKMVWAIECKLMLSFHLLAQARECCDYATYTSIATPPLRSRQWEDSQTIKEILEFMNIGWLTVCPSGVKSFEMLPKGDANTAYFLEALRPEHKTQGVAGSKAGTAWTPFKGLAEAVATFVRMHPGVSMKDICQITEVQKYYKTKNRAQSALRQWLKKGVIKHVRVENSHGKISYWPFDPATEPRI